MRALARAVGRTQQAVRKWSLRDDWPFGRAGPYDPVAVEKWHQKTLGKRDRHGHRVDDAGDDAVQPAVAGDGTRLLGALSAARVDLVRARTKKLVMENEIREGLWVERRIVWEENAAALALLRSMLLTDARSIADALDNIGALADGAREQAEDEIRSAIASALNAVADRLEHKNGSGT